MRWIVRLLSGLLALLVVGVGLVFLIPSQQVADAVARQFSTLTGRELTIAGSVRPSVWPMLGVRTGPVTIANAAWSVEGPMLQADGLEIGVDLAALWGGTVRIVRVAVDNPVLLLESAQDGQANWQFGGTNGGTVTTGTPGVGSPFTLDIGLIRNGALTYIDHKTGARVAVSGIEAEGAFPDFNGPATLTAQGRANGQDFALQGAFSSFSTLLQGKVTPVDLALSAGDARIGFIGRMGTGPLTAEGKLEAALGDLSAITRLAGVARPALPAGLGATSVALDGTVTLTDAGAVYLRGGVVTLDGNPLKGDADFLTAGERPKLSAQISAGTLTFAAAETPAGAGDGTGAAPAGGWSRDPIDVSGLAAMDATVAVTAQSLDLGGAKFGATRFVMTLDRARAVFDLRESAAYSGRITGQFVVNGRGGLSLGGDLRFAGLAMQPLLADVAGYDRLVGSGDVALKFLAVGNSVDALMQGLSGSGKLAFGKGELRGLDVAGMLRTLDAGYVGDGAKTIFDQISASFTIADGVLSNDDLRLTAPLLTATGAGAVGIGPRTLDYRVVPVALAESDGSGGFKVPLLITGSWDAPAFRLDLEALAREKLEAEAKLLEEKARAELAKFEEEAKAKLAAKAQEELGLTVQEGENVEEAARRRAEEVLREEGARALQNLLGGN